MFTSSIQDLKPKGDRKRIIIVGGGTVGIYAAVELCKRGHEVVLIEAGRDCLDNFEPETYTSVGFPHRGISIGRSRSLGGTSNLWGGQLVEFQPVDFAGRPWIPDSQWPVEYAEIAPYYKQTYENLGIPAELLDDTEVFKRLQTDVPSLENGLELFLTRWLKIPSMAAAYRQEIQTQPLLQTLLEHTVTGLLGDQGKIRSVTVQDRHGNRHSIDGDLFILAAGTIETVRLMLHAATTEGWECPWKDNANVGKYFQDHIGGRVAAIHPIDQKRFLDLFSSIVLGGHKFQPKLRLKNSCLEAEHVLNIQAMLHFESSISENLVFLKQFLKAAVYSRKITGVAELARNLVACAKHLPPLMWRYIVQNRIFVPSGSKISLLLQSEQMPLSTSSMSIDPSTRDRHGLPKLVLDWRLGEEEMPSLREFALRCKSALEKAKLAEVHILEGLLSLDPRFMDTLRDNYHQVGGTRIGWTSEDAVVDGNLKVFGTENLYVLGASTFRTTGNANTTFVAMAFATRLVAKLSGH